MNKDKRYCPNNCVDCAFLDDTDLPNIYCNLTNEFLNADPNDDFDIAEERHITCPYN